MATPTYFPNPVAAMPEPRFRAPQQDYSSVFQGALQSLTSVADNYRRKQQSVQSADKMAGLLEAEGMQSEANAYRQAAQAYDINFFSTPQENEQFNRSVLNDTLKLLSAKQDRELRERAINLQAEYQRGSLANQRLATEVRAESGGGREDSLQLRRDEAAVRQSEYDIDNGFSRLAKVEALGKNNEDQVKAGVLKGDAAIQAQAQIEAERRRIIEDIDNAKLRKQGHLARLSGIENPSTTMGSSYVPLFKNPLTIGSVPQTRIDETQANANLLNQNPGLNRVGDVSAQRPGTTSSRIELPTGEVRTTVTPNITPAVKGLDPTAPKFDTNRLTTPAPK